MKESLFSLVVIFSALLGASAIADQDNTKVEGTSKEIVFGKHWAGPEVKAPADLKGKVVLLVIWGG